MEGLLEVGCRKICIKIIHIFHILLICVYNLRRLLFREIVFQVFSSLGNFSYDRPLINIIIFESSFKKSVKFMKENRE